MRKYLKYIGLAGALMSGTIVFAQHKAIDTIEYRVVQQANANIANGVKLNSNPAIADTMKPSRKVDYSTIGNQYATAYTPPSLQPVQLKGEPLDNLYHSLLSVGGGNYNTAYAEYFFNSLRSRDWDYGIHLNHVSTNFEGYNSGLSSFNFNDANLYATRYIGNHTISAKADVDERMVHNYGYDTAVNELTKDITKERYYLFDGGLRYMSHFTDSSRVNHDIKLGYYNYSDMYGTTENNVDVNAHVTAFIDKQRLDVKLIGQYFNDENIMSLENFGNVNSLGSSKAINLGFNPYVTGGGKHWDAHIGLKAYLDAVNGGTNLLPDLFARYHIADNALIIYAGFDGDKEYNSYKSLTTANPFLQDTLNQQYTITAYHGFVGLTGSITNQITYDINASQSQVKNMPLFITDTLETLQNRFTVVYDDVQILNGHADINYQMKEDMRFNLSGDWYQYMAKNQLEVWYHPTLKINLLGEYTFMKKYIFKAELFYVNSQYAPEIVDNVLTAKQLSGYPDINLGVDYKYSKLLTAFLHLNNLANTAYYQWNNYPTQRLNFLAGIRFAF